MKRIGNRLVRILQVNPEQFSVKLEFGDGSKETVSLASIFDKPKGLAAEILRGGAFEKCFVDGGALAWPNGLELCPDALRQWASQQKRAA